MNLTTITFDADKWQLAPKEPSKEMLDSITLYIPAAMSSNELEAIESQLQDEWRAMLAAAPQPPELSPWLPIESAPKDGSNFYVTGFNYGNASNGRWHDVGHVTPRGGIKSTLTWLNLDFATHWMPMPQAPTASLDATAPEVE